MVRKLIIYFITTFLFISFGFSQTDEHFVKMDAIFQIPSH